MLKKKWYITYIHQHMLTFYSTIPFLQLRKILTKYVAESLSSYAFIYLINLKDIQKKYVYVYQSSMNLEITYHLHRNKYKWNIRQTGEVLTIISIIYKHRMCGTRSLTHSLCIDIINQTKRNNCLIYSTYIQMNNTHMML